MVHYIMVGFQLVFVPQSLEVGRCAEKDVFTGCAFQCEDVLFLLISSILYICSTWGQFEYFWRAYCVGLVSPFITIVWLCSDGHVSKSKSPMHNRINSKLHLIELHKTWISFRKKNGYSNRMIKQSHGRQQSQICVTQGRVNTHTVTVPYCGIPMD